MGADGSRPRHILAAATACAGLAGSRSRPITRPFTAAIDAPIWTIKSALPRRARSRRSQPRTRHTSACRSAEPAPREGPEQAQHQSPQPYQRRQNVGREVGQDHLQGHPEIASVEHKQTDGDVLVVTLNDGSQDGSFIAELLVKNGFRLKMLQEEEIDLEDVFMGITKGITN